MGEDYVGDQIAEMRAALEDTLYDNEQPTDRELAMLIRAGVRPADIDTALHRWSRSRSTPRDLWPFLRTIAWGEALRRQEAEYEARGGAQ